MCAVGVPCDRYRAILDAIALDLGYGARRFSSWCLRFLRLSGSLWVMAILSTARASQRQQRELPPSLRRRQ